MATVQTQIPDLPNKAYMLPDSVPMWPPIWWAWPLLAAIFLIVLLGTIWHYRRHKAKAYRREALQAFSDQLNTLSDKDCILLCHEMVRRCLVSEAKTETAALPSQLLFKSLDTSMPAKLQFSSLVEDFIEGPYRQHITLSAPQRAAIIDTTRYWIRKHRA